MAKKILVLFHFNFLKRNMGCANGVYIPVKILKDMGFLIDFFSTNSDDDFSDFNVYNNEKLIDNLYLIDVKKIKLINKIKNKIMRVLRPYHLNSRVTNLVLNEFQKIISITHYDFIYVHYIDWADLFRYGNITANTEIIYNMHDNCFMQYFYDNEILELGKMFEDEFDALKYFHSYICNSHDEMLFWSKLYPHRKFYFFPPVNPHKELPDVSKTIDVLFVAAYNPHNIRGAIWFLNEALPHLPPNISITFCGKFLSGLESRYLEKASKSNITMIDFAEDLEALYARTKVVIVPILGGTGIKIKTIEALSYSIPVVSTLLGVDGFPDKYENGCLVSDDPAEFAGYIKKLLEDESFYHSVKTRSNDYFNRHFSFEQNKNILREVFGDCDDQKN